MSNLKEDLIKAYGLKLGIFVSVLINEYDKNRKNCSLNEEDFFELKNLTLFNLLSLNKKDIKKFHKYGKEMNIFDVKKINNKHYYKINFLEVLFNVIAHQEVA